MGTATRTAVAGATGRVGRHVVEILQARGAQALADLAADADPAVAPGAAATSIPEIAGPREENLITMAMLLAARRDDPVEVEAFINQADPDRDLYLNGALLPGPHATLAGPTFEECLDSTS